MSHPLLLKELRSLAPFVALVFFFDLLNWADVLFTKFPDQYPLAKLLEDSGSDQVLMFMVAFALAAGLLMREVDEGTLSFLDALPVSRTRVFFAKTALALGVIWLLPLSDLILRVTLYSWSRTSLEPHIQWSPLVTRALLDAVAGLVYFSLGLALSFLRRYSLLLLGLLFCIYSLLQEWQIPFIALFNIFSLSEPAFQGRRWLLPTDKLAVQSGLAVLCLAGAFGAFQFTGDSARRLAERVKRRRGVVLLGALGTGLMVVIWIGLLVHWAKQSPNDAEPTVRYESWATARARTAHYGLLYPGDRANLVAQLLHHADGVEGRVRQFLGAQPIPWIMADLTGSDPHTAGVAHWKQVQIDLSAIGDDADDLTAVFAHETTHVYIAHESQDRLDDDPNATRFFHEGLATYVEYHLFRPAAQLARLRRVAATMQARHEVRFEDLIDRQALARKYDADLVYPLGEVFVDALVRRYGAPAVGRVIRGFARPGAPTGLKGAELWRDVFQAQGGNLSDVEDLFFAELDQAAAEHREFVDSLPRLRGAVYTQPRYLLVRASYTGRSPGTILCRFRANADTPDRLYEYARESQPGVFWVARARYPEPPFWYQLGWLVPGASQPIYEAWVEVRSSAE